MLFRPSRATVAQAGRIGPLIGPYGALEDAPPLAGIEVPAQTALVEVHGDDADRAHLPGTGDVDTIGGGRDGIRR